MEFVLAAVALTIVILYCFQGVIVFLATILGMMAGGFWAGITSGLVTYLIINILKGAMLGFIVGLAQKPTKPR